ncbi:putative F-box/LRR-repeat protein 9 [Panicum miliaceum]|uniref:F-box/LRR-repeat protein 9 n=1 Tax=Panicum miliaceum TaxID=4540 RepID=A0A3L6RL30_PANMI|nr:putative F-box/LRR-repeat protein 9 [Panicum miliaceum]
MPSSSASRRRGRNKPATPAAHPEAVGRAAAPAPAPMPRLPPPAGFARRALDPAPDAAATERARGPVAAPRLPQPAAFASGPGPAPRVAPPNPSPADPQARPPTPPPSSSRRRRRRRRNRGRKADEARDWASLPRDVLVAVFGKLDHIEILTGAGQACRSWRRAAREDPSLWRRVDMRGHDDLFNQVNLHGMAQAAVRRANGQCEAFWGEYARLPPVPRQAVRTRSSDSSNSNSVHV